MAPSSKVALLVCGGIGRIVSTVVRQAAYMVTSDRPERVVLVSSGSLTGDVLEALEAARAHPLIVVDACVEKCATAIAHGKGLEAAETVWLPAVVAKHKLSLRGEDRKGLSERGLALARKLADEIIVHVDAMLDAGEEG